MKCQYLTQSKVYVILKSQVLEKNIHQALFQDTRIKIEVGIKMIYALTLHYWSSKVQACIFLILSKFIVDTFESSLYIRGIGNDKEIYKCTISIRLFKVGLVVVVFWFSFNYTRQMWNCNYSGFYLWVSPSCTLVVNLATSSWIYYIWEMYCD